MKKHNVLKHNSGAVAATRADHSKRRQKPLNLQVKGNRSGGQDSRTSGPARLWNRLKGHDLTPAMAGVILFLLCFQVFLHFQIFNQKPVPGPAAEYFPAGLGYQNIDVPGWIWTGMMLPGNAPKVRAMRPLYPAPLAVARGIGLLHVDPALKLLPPGESPASDTSDYARAITLLKSFNCALALVSLWTFFALCRHFSMTPTSAAMATFAAGSGFGFSFWVTQSVPEVFGYFAVVVALAAIVIGFEREAETGEAHEEGDKPGFNKQRLVLQATIWGGVGLAVGVLLLGKEVFSLPIFGALLLLGARRWVGLIAFCVMVLVPSLLWNFYISKIVGAFDPAAYLKEYRFVIWLFQDLPPMSWGGRFATLSTNLKAQLVSFSQAFAYVPVVLAAVGLIFSRALPRQNWVVAFFFVSFYLLFLLSNFIMPRLLFMTWPVVFFFGWLGVEHIAGWLGRLAENPESQQTISKYLKLAALAGLVVLGTRHQFAWYYYG